MIALPSGPFGTIVADPPWRFRDSGVRGAAQKHYKTMSIEEIARMPVEEIAAENAHLYLWAPDAFIIDGTTALIARMWSFEPKLTLCWRKVKDDRPQMGQGHYYRHCYELCVFCVRGKASAPDGARNILAMFDAERTRKHSEKPAELFAMAERMSPGPRLEMFARAKREGWTVWGDQAPTEPGSPEQIVERLNEKVRTITANGVERLRELIGNGEADDRGANLVPALEDEAEFDARTRMIHAVGCYVSGFGDDGVTETWTCIPQCPVSASPYKMIVGKDYALPDGRVGEYVGGENFHVKPADASVRGPLVRALASQVVPTDLISAIECPDCHFLIAAEAAANAEACPYCTRSERICSVCGAAQFDSPSGVTCKNGHGGADAAEEKA